MNQKYTVSFQLLPKLSRNASPHVTIQIRAVKKSTACYNALSHNSQLVLSYVTLTSASSALISSLGGSPSLASVYRAVATAEEILVSFCKRQINNQ